MFSRSSQSVQKMAMVAIAAILTAGHASAEDSPSQSRGLLTRLRIHGGICVIAGARSLNLAQELAGNSNFYIQVLQPDQSKAITWGAAVASGEYRERIGVVHRVFDADHYGSGLFNLVIADAPKAASDTADLKRILVPGGTLAVRQNGESTPGLDPKVAGLISLQAADGWHLFRKPAEPVVKYSPCDSLRWRAGSRWQRMMYHDFQSVKFGEGKFLYRETMASSGGGYRFELVCRDAFNGRTLWKIEEPPFSGKDWSSYLRYRMALAVHDGKVYTGLGKDFVSLDAVTGNTVTTLAKGGRPRQFRIHQAKYLLVDGKILDLESLKELGRYKGVRIVVSGDRIYATNQGRIITTYRIPDGEVLWTKDVREIQPAGQFAGMFCSDTALHIRRSWPAASLSTMDIKTGETLWTYPPPPRPKVRDVNAYVFGNELLISYRDTTINEPRDFVLMAVKAKTGEALRKGLYAPGKKWAGGCWGARRAGDYLLYHHNLWFNTKTSERTYLVMFRPKCSQGPLPSNGMIYGFPGRKGGAIKGIAALAPRDMEFNDGLGGKVLKTYSKAPEEAPQIRENDWPIFRGNPARGNSVNLSLSHSLVPKWQAVVGLGKQTYGTMDSERTGLTQAVSAWGLVVVADIEGQRIVALKEATGKIEWVYHVGSRVDFPPTLHQGLCLFAAKDGSAYCLDARTGKPIYKLLIAPQERYIGGQEKLESMWPACADVLVVGDTAYCSAGLAVSIHGGIRVVAFRPRSGEVVWSRCIQGKPARNDGETQPSLLVYDGKQIRMGGMAFDPKTGKSIRAHRGGGFLNMRGSMEDWLSTNNRNRISEDMGSVSLDDGRKGITGRLISFTENFGIGFSVPRKGKTVFHIGPINITGKSRDGQAKWSLPPTEMNVDDFVLTADTAYCVGHYESGSEPSELRVISLKDGTMLSRHEVSGFPVYNGMSIANDKLFIATRGGKLICFGAPE
ncbi:MAG: PQQ-binding-like beta-propeller repeat protein [Planctomycetota bacterium]|nr:PQQ-binding-like beta-propeller repeat protein [Planctomycetota bacterium]